MTGPVGPDGTDDFLASFSEADFANLDFDAISEAEVDPGPVWLAAAR